MESMFHKIHLVSAFVSKVYLLFKFDAIYGITYLLARDLRHPDTQCSVYLFFFLFLHKATNVSSQLETLVNKSYFYCLIQEMPNDK